MLFLSLLRHAVYPHVSCLCLQVFTQADMFARSTLAILLRPCLAEFIHLRYVLRTCTETFLFLFTLVLDNRAVGKHQVYLTGGIAEPVVIGGNTKLTL